MPLPELAYLSLGSNLGDRSASLRTAIDRLADAGAVRAVSGFYETEPVEVLDQPWFLNCAVALEFRQPPELLLKMLLAIEEKMGRARFKNKGPRVIDIDIVLFGDRVVNEPGLKIPHPGMQDRRFVLEPLAEIAPYAVHPVLRKTVRDLLVALPAGQSVRRLALPEPNPQPAPPVKER
ncbi:MAG TPA: 2-amino-4-hydroxy-6-hydroxymethyldihydropteridine diphosphokinase [Terriglobales bacterium]|nr:2-amino-4-hydroxy-6-hydroxymethyldihydropteridine diphosphokinase [Terriglobales bacterium]